VTSPNDKESMYFASDPTELGLSVSAMVWRDGELLLMRRADNGHWGLPGGFVELGESVSEAARREVAEETGWEVEVGRLIGVYSDPATQVVDYGRQKGAAPDGEDRRIQVVNLCFYAEARSQGTPTTPDETLEMGFFGVEALPQPFVPIHTIRIEDGLAGRAEAAIR
jgi:ADP-ribose pyrophosphatase YjhB (NUDIX family)